MQKRRSPWALAYFLIGLVCALIAASSAAFFTRVDDLMPIVLAGVPGLVLTLRSPVHGVSVRCLSAQEGRMWLTVSCQLWLPRSGRPALRGALAAD